VAILEKLVVDSRLVQLTSTDSISKNSLNAIFSVFRYKTGARVFPFWWYNWSKGCPSGWKVLYTTARSHWDVFLHVAVHTRPKVQRMGMAGCAGLCPLFFPLITASPILPLYSFISQYYGNAWIIIAVILLINLMQTTLASEVPFPCGCWGGHNAP